MKVLVADDNRDAAISLGVLLEMSGHEVLIAHDGEEALKIAREALPDAMILDIGMPRLTGDQVARAVRSEPWGRRLFLVAVGQRWMASMSRDAMRKRMAAME